MSADELMTQGTEQALDVARAWLLTQLADGAQQAINLQIAAAAKNISDRTLNRAKKSLGIVSRKTKDSWLWELPK